MFKTAPDLFKYPKYQHAEKVAAPFLPMSRAEMDTLGWDQCDIIIISGDAYVDHPSFGMAVIGRTLEAQGFRVGIIAQPDWQSAEPFKILGEPKLYFGITAGNMDSMINRYTADLKVRNDDAYTPNNEGGKRPERAVLVYSQRCKEAYPKVPIVLGGIEASLRRIAQYDYWSNKVRHSILFDSNADILLYGNAERALVEVTHRLANNVPIGEITDVRGTVVLKKEVPNGWTEIDSSRIDWPSNIGAITEFNEPNPYEQKEPINEAGDKASCGASDAASKTEVDDNVSVVRIIPMPLQRKFDIDHELTCIRLPSFEKIRNDPALYAHASRVLHVEANPHNAHTLVQRHGNREVWVNPPPIPLRTEEMDGVFDLEYARVPHPSYGKAKIPAYDMIKTSINIMRGCFGGCTFCSITEHEGRIIQSRSHESVLKEVEDIKAKVPGFSGALSDLGGPTANMYHLQCKDDAIQASCRRLSCVYPTICVNLKTDHSMTTQLYRKVRKTPGIHTVAIASGLRYDLAIEDPEYVKELVTHHVGGYLKIAPEHTETRPLQMMMKPGMGSYDRFKQMFDKYSKEAGKKQYLIPYFIAAHPGCEDEDMVNLALWLKNQDMKVDQVQTFYPSPMSLGTAMYFSGKNPLKKVTYKSPRVNVVKKIEERQLQKALLRYHDKSGWHLIRDALQRMGLARLIGDGDHCLVPAEEKQSVKRQPYKGVPKAKLATKPGRSGGRPAPKVKTILPKKQRKK
ncbi:MAG: YgiQ family radical SAM protein [Reinekea forsetii]|nr:YgiQ family radical SAM protein [Reinekea forsetii]